ncbi:MAG: hypothetical protein ACRD8U_13585, partial [Pyrinomonadaceae bacterium]
LMSLCLGAFVVEVIAPTKSNFREAFFFNFLYAFLKTPRERGMTMIRKMSHATIFVNNQDEALEKDIEVAPKSHKSHKI